MKNRTSPGCNWRSFALGAGEWTPSPFPVVKETKIAISVNTGVENKANHAVVMLIHYTQNCSELSYKIQRVENIYGNIQSSQSYNCDKLQNMKLDNFPFVYVESYEALLLVNSVIHNVTFMESIFR